ncbi:hypothetical protein BB561_000477 [Smittium simulii]|uniref:tRNA (cytosine(38)-C(5))-methyltransferase n=1 Tax=Smittium simulii TaxID=133385 RepID=A0A2T9YZ33_9FUNG|nr:hypothetical protein BB561_000477 [Smittium simulii]
MHFSLEKAKVDYEVVSAFDINPIANSVYRHNFPSVNVVQRNIEALSLNYYEKLNADLWTMSPPCQPRGSDDPRSKSFLFLVDLLGKLKNKPSFIVLENVAGFEKSDSRKLLLTQLVDQGFSYEEYILNPIQFGYPNSRTRYYLIASRDNSRILKNDLFNPNNCEFLHTIDGIDMISPVHSNSVQSLESNVSVSKKIDFEKSLWKDDFSHQISDFLDDLDQDKFKKYSISQKLLDSHGYVFDVVMPSSRRSCCFTKGYYHYNQGTGSVLQISGTVGVDIQTSENTRYFTEYEIARLLGFPEKFNFIEKLEPEMLSQNCLVTLKQRYRLLGNSLSVVVVSNLFKHLFLS